MGGALRLTGLAVLDALLDFVDGLVERVSGVPLLVVATVLGLPLMAHRPEP